VDVLKEALWAKTADEAADALSADTDLLGASVFADCLGPALMGQWRAVEMVVGTWRGAIDEALIGFSPKVSDVVIHGAEIQVKSIGGVASRSGLAMLHSLVADVPTSPLLEKYGFGPGVSLTLLRCVRSALPHGPGVFEIPTGFPDLPLGADVSRFRRLCEIAVRRMVPPLTYVANQFGLSRQELGSLFGVSRQAVDDWETRERVPERHAAKLADLVAVAELLDRKLKPGRLQLVVRRPSPAFGGRSFLDMAREGLLEDVRRQTEEALDWAGTA
jgi:transcriptional regulator with XRE-family HTH domain